MNGHPFDELSWPPRKRCDGRGVRHLTPPVAGTLKLPDGAVQGAWHDDFLLLGSRLRPAWGGEIRIDEEAPAYVIAYAEDYDVSVTCPVGEERADSVRVSCPVLTVPAGTTGIFEFALRENADLPLARLAYRGQELVAEHELPFVAAGIPALRTAVDAVGWAARRLRPELSAACLHSAG
jgi:hypothetical protein